MRDRRPDIQIVANDPAPEPIRHVGTVAPSDAGSGWSPDGERWIELRGVGGIIGCKGDGGRWVQDGASTQHMSLLIDPLILRPDGSSVLIVLGMRARQIGMAGKV